MLNGSFIVAKRYNDTHMITSLETFYEKAEPHVALFDAFAQKHVFEDQVFADHICFKCDTKDLFESIKTLFEFESSYLYQSVISGRSIAYIKMKKGIDTKLGTIYFLELSDQKPDGSSRAGFDHIEVYPVAISYEEMIAQLAASENIQKVERPHHTTHDVVLENGFIFRCEAEPLLEKIKRTEMV